eukprot:TRINITY_DN1677_c0_g2_i1.p4 TRINITY_DN1677_c0_g2~~TRINITY_DN1677_c0_g2_i1.p4  ORF type:complete len:103 (-),score=10.23 TRINITY_DN1677_c0_g2_i1:41-349(-)
MLQHRNLLLSDQKRKFLLYFQCLECPEPDYRLGLYCLDKFYLLYLIRGCLTHVPVSYTHLTLPTICSVQISVVAVSLKKKKTINNIIATGKIKLTIMTHYCN